MAKPKNLAWAEILGNLKNQTYVRVLAGPAGLSVHRIDDLLADPGRLGDLDRIFVAQDRVRVDPAEMARFTEAVETAMHFGRGEVRVFEAE